MNMIVWILCCLLELPTCTNQPIFFKEHFAVFPTSCISIFNRRVMKILSLIKARDSTRKSVEERYGFQPKTSLRKKNLAASSLSEAINVELLIRASSNQTIPNIISPKAGNHTKRRPMTITQKFLAKVSREQTHPFPEAFQLIRIEKQRKPVKNSQFDHISHNILAYSNVKLVDIAVDIVCKLGMLEICSRMAVTKLVRAIEAGYNIVAYHNFAHGFSLMYMFYKLLKIDKKFRILLTKEEIGFALIAGLAHDINHPGTNNDYEVKINSELSIVANKNAVLQKMHIRTFFNLIESENITIIEKSSNPKKNKQLIVRLILATDFSKHFKNLQQINQIVEKNEFDPSNSHHRYMALEHAFHACDISNPCLEFQDYVNWAALLSYEFDYQVALQIKKNVPVSEKLRYRGLRHFYNEQIGFIDHLVLPLWRSLASIWPTFKCFVNRIERNSNKLKEKAKNVRQKYQGKTRTLFLK